MAGLNNRSYTGSAAAFIPNDPVAINLLYAVMVVRALERLQLSLDAAGAART